MNNDAYQQPQNPDDGKDESNNLRPPWTSPGFGTFTGFNYNRPGAADGLDPYLVWSDVGGFANLRKPGQKPGDLSHIPTWLPILIELAPGVPLADLIAGRENVLIVEPAYRERASDESSQIVPARVKKGFFKDFEKGRLLELIQRIELDLPEDVPPKQEVALGGSAAKNVGGSSSNRETGLLTGKVIAFIDDGCAFAHTHFLNGAGASAVPRVKRLWDQNERATTSPHTPPAGFTEGRAFTDVELKAMIGSRTYDGVIDEDAVYRDFAAGTRDNVNRLLRRVSHGTHVMDLACGPYFLADTMCTRRDAHAENPTWERTLDDASTAPIIFVQLPMRTVQSTSGKGTLTADVLHALEYISNQCDDDAEIVVNLSWGTLAGPHDGSTLLERGIDSQIAASRAGRLRVVIPAGNGAQSRTHARFALKPNKSRVLNWRVPADDATESYLEIWMQAADQISITITLPNGDVLPPITQGLVYKFIDPSQPFADPVSIFGVNYANSPPLGQNGKCALLAIAPTTSLLASRPVAPHGLWKLEIKNVKNQPITALDAYIERDDVAIGTRRGARQSSFEDPTYKKHDTEDQSPAPSGAYAFREGIFNGIANGKRVVTVGGIRESDWSLAEYSPSGVYTLPARPGTKTAVDYFATSEESRTLQGVRAAGTRSGATVRLSGTSDAAPQIARDQLNGNLP